MKQNYLRRILSAAILFLVSTIMWAYDFYVDGIYYNFLYDGNVEVTYEKMGNTLEYRGNITIPSTVTYDGKTYNVTGIGESAFGGCSRLVSVDIPESVTSIEGYAFNNCTSLTSILIPESVTFIGGSAFYGCSSLESINIPDGVTFIGPQIFYQCSSLEFVNIPESVTFIGGQAFYECTSLKSINIPESVTSIEYYTFYRCSSLKSIIIPESVTSIGSRAFYYCSSLTSIDIPSRVISIGDNAFLGCSSSLESITVSEDNLDYDSRDGCNAIIDSYTNTLIVGCKNTIIPESVTSIGESAFQHCSSLESIVIPESVTNIGDDAFYGCSSLTSINIPSSVTSIGEYTFYYCSALTSINIPNSVASIGDYAFYGCSSLTTVICRAENVPELGNYAFYNVPTYRSTLYVPASALEDYKAADGWRYFETILPIVELDYAQKEGWNTIVLPFSADLETFGEGAKAYAFTGATDGVLSFSTVDHLEAHTPYIIYAPEAQDLSLNNFHDTTDPNATTAPSVEQSGVTFRGTYEDIDAPDMQGKYGVADDARIRRGSELASIKAYHAYFEAAAGAEVKAISFDGDDTTGIIEIADALQQDAQYYNLAGQRTQKPQKGVNIVNGKKVLY